DKREEMISEIKSAGIKQYYLPYRVRSRIMSQREMELFVNLRKVLGSRFDIYPQAKLDKIFFVDLPKTSKYHDGCFYKISQKSVDFLIVEKEFQKPVFAIELDDFTHEDINRRIRDGFVEELFRVTKFPLVRFNEGQYGEEELKRIFGRYL
ncbi:MAG TPA: DUF2726 domain-containing protein, partial [Patescibacteria group bacterium]